MPGFRLKPIGPELWEIQREGTRVGQLQCSWAHGYQARFADESDTKLAAEFWLWIRAYHDQKSSSNRFKWL